MSRFEGMHRHGVPHRSPATLLVALLATLVVLVALAVSAALTVPAAAAPRRAADPILTGTLPLGAAGLAEVRTTRTLQAGVTLTRIVRGAPDPTDVWTVDVGSALTTQARATRLARSLTDSGFTARAEDVTTPAVADFAGGSLGFRVRVGSFGSRTEALAELALLRINGFDGATTFTGWDGRPDGQGPWQAWVLTIDPRTFRGALAPSYGADLLHRDRTSTIVARTKARAAVNAGYFVLDPASGAPGDPAGVGVYGGRVLSEAANGRPALVVTRRGRSSVVRFVWHGRVRGPAGRLRLDGINRVPGLISGCGGIGGDLPTQAPQQGITCTDTDEVVAFTGAYAAGTPSGAGVEAVVNRTGVVTRVRGRRGGRIPAGGFTVQATGTLVTRLRAVAVKGQPLRLRSALATPAGRPVAPSANTGVVNGGPVLVAGGVPTVTAAQDGFARTPGLYYAFSAKRNPRTIAGTDSAGRTVLAVVDGRSTASLGLTLTESAQVAQSLGLRDAINLDGGGSSTMVVGKAVRNHPSDGSERAIGDALLVLPRR
jgi:hypothetical protein